MAPTEIKANFNFSVLFKNFFRTVHSSNAVPINLFESWCESVALSQSVIGTEKAPRGQPIKRLNKCYVP